MQSINQLANVQTTGANIVGKFSIDTLGQNLTGMTMRGVVNAGVNSAIYGGSFGESFKSSLVSDAAAVGANAVGLSTETRSPGNVLGHAAVGAVAAQLKGQDADSGAIGGAAGALVNPLLDRAIGGADGSGWGSDPQTAPQWQSATLQLASMGVSAGIASAFGKDGMTAATAAQNETVNNYLSNWQERARDKELKSCETGNVCKAIVQAKWAATSIGQDGRLVSGMALGSVLTAKDLAAAIPEIPGVVIAILQSPEVLQGLGGAYSQELQDTYQRYTTALEAAGPDGATAAGVEFIKLLNLVAPVVAAGQLAVSVSKQTVSLLGKSAAVLKGGAKGAAESSFSLATSEDLAAIRLKYSVPEGNTLAVARTDIPGLEGTVVEGLSPSLRARAGLPSLDEVYGVDRTIKSPYQNPLFTRHAEEDLFNGLSQKIDSSGLSATDLAGKTVDVKISNMSGVCNKCTAGLSGSSDLSGVVQQFSNRYPDLTVRITAEGGTAMPGRTTVLIRGGKIVN